MFDGGFSSGSNNNRNSSSNNSNSNSNSKRSKKKIEAAAKKVHNKHKFDAVATASSSRQHSVSFSIEEDHEADVSHMDSHLNSQMDHTKSTHSSDQDTFSLGSLALSRDSNSRTSRASSYTSKSSKSSRSSRSSHGSATTTSTQSSGNSTERRRRRELLPVKQDRKKVKQERKKRGSKHDTGSISSMSGSSAFSGSALSAVFNAGTGGSALSGLTGSALSGSAGKPSKKLHSRRHSRKKGSHSHISDDASCSDGSTSSRNLYSNSATGRRSSRSKQGSSHNSRGSNTSYSDGEGPYGNLHDQHPIRYPKRHSGIFGIEEGEDDSAENENDSPRIPQNGNSNRGGRTTSDRDRRGGYDGVDSSTDEEGLFRRVDRVRNEIKLGLGNKNNDALLDSLLGSGTPAGKSASPRKSAGTLKFNGGSKTRTKVGDDDVSEQSSSFLSNLVKNNNAARQRKKSGSVKSGDQSTDAGGGSTDASTGKDEESGMNINIYQKKHNERRATLDRGANFIRATLDKIRDVVPGVDSVVISLSRCYHDGGDLLPSNKREWVVLLVCTFLLMPLVHVAIIHALGDGSSSSIFGDQIQFVGDGMGSSMQDGEHPSLYYAREATKAWAGSSQVMLSEPSSLNENFILMPDADWIELQISRSKAATKKSNGGGGGGFFSSLRGGNNDIKPPKRLPLPPVLDPVYNSSAAMVLFSFTASNGNNLPENTNIGNINLSPSHININANMNLWDAIQQRLSPPPMDVWPCWSHNSLAQYREDGFTVMYPYAQRRRALTNIKKLAKEFGQSVIYEYVTWSEMSPPADIGDGMRGKYGGGTHVGKDGVSSIIIPPLANGRSDVMIRRTISLTERNNDLPEVVMRRVKDLPVEDELTMREWEGPSLEEIVWY